MNEASAGGSSGMGARLMASLPYILLLAVTAWLWSVANADMEDSREVAFISSRFTGVAREHVDQWPPRC